MHPEVSFATMADAPLSARKSSWAGVENRRQLLADNQIVVNSDLGVAGAAARVDNVLDAAAAAWSARRVAAGTAERLPDPPEIFCDGWPGYDMGVKPAVSTGRNDSLRPGSPG